MANLEKLQQRVEELERQLAAADRSAAAAANRAEKALNRALDAERERDRYVEREAHFASVLGVADGGQYRADWDGAIRNLLARAGAAEQGVSDWKALAEEKDRDIHRLSTALQAAEREREEAQEVLRAAVAALDADGVESQEGSSVELRIAALSEDRATEKSARERAEAELAEFRAYMGATRLEEPDPTDVPGLQLRLNHWRAGARMENTRAAQALEEVARLRQQREEDAQTVRMAIDAQAAAEADNAALGDLLARRTVSDKGATDVEIECMEVLHGQPHPGAALLDELRTRGQREEGAIAAIAALGVHTQHGLSHAVDSLLKYVRLLEKVRGAAEPYRERAAMLQQQNRRPLTDQEGDMLAACAAADALKERTI